MNPEERRASINGPMLELGAEWLSRATRITTFSGAGLSKASGIPTYRDSGGLWTQGNNLSFSTADAMKTDPAGFQAFWRARQAELEKASPNLAHLALARLGTLKPETVHITQNIDGLLTQAGCTTVHELHGNLGRYRCDSCGYTPLPPVDECTECGSAARPDVVMFGEHLPYGTLAQADFAAKRCEVMLVVGTSAVVHPAAGLAEKAKFRGARIVVINPEESALDHLADGILTGTAEELVPRLVERTAQLLSRPRG